MSVPSVLFTGKVMVCFSHRCDGAWHSLVQQAEAQGVLTARAVTKVQAGRAALAFLHPDEGLDLSVHLELHQGLDQWPMRTTSVRVSAVQVHLGAADGDLSLTICFGWFPSSLQHLESSPDLTHYGCHGIPSHTLRPTWMSSEFLMIAGQ